MTTRTSLPVLRLCAAAVLALAMGACDSAPVGAAAGAVAGTTPGATAPTPPAKAAPEDLAARISAEIGDAACDSSQQCRTLAYGHKACGGPERYVAYSTKRGDSARLAQLAQQLADQRRRQDEAEGMMSTCSAVLDPGAVCSAGRCTLQPGTPGGAPLAR